MKKKRKATIMITTEYPLPPSPGISRNIRSYPHKSIKSDRTRLSHNDRSRARYFPHHGIAPSLSLCFSFLANPSIVPVRLNFLVAFFQFDPAPTLP